MRILRAVYLPVDLMTKIKALAAQHGVSVIAAGVELVRYGLMVPPSPSTPFGDARVRITEAPKCNWSFGPPPAIDRIVCARAQQLGQALSPTYVELLKKGLDALQASPQSTDKYIGDLTSRSA